MLSLLKVIAKLPYEAPEQESLQLGGDVWLHVTPSYNVESIMESGLELDYFTEGGLDQFVGETFTIYGMKPIFVFKSAQLYYLEEAFGDAYGKTLLQLDLRGIPLMADVNSLDAGYDEGTDTLYWEHESYVPAELQPYVAVDQDEQGESYYIDVDLLLDPNSPECKAAIEASGTAAVLSDISPDRIKVVG